jgi:hypothetical protein
LGIAAGHLMLGAITSFLPESAVGGLRDVVLQMMTVFQAQLTVPTRDLAYSLARSLGDSFRAEALPVDANELFHMLLEIVGNAELEVDLLVVPFIARYELIADHGKELENGAATELLTAAIVCAGRADAGEFYRENDSTTFIASIADIAVSHTTDRDFFHILKDLQRLADSPSMLLAYCCVVFNSLGSDDVVDNMSFIYELIVSQLRSDSPHVQEVALLMAIDVSACFTDEHIELSTGLVEALLPLLEGTTLIFDTLHALVDILNEVSVAARILQPIIERLMALVNDPDATGLHALAVEALAALVFAAEEDVEPYAEELFPVIQQAASQNSDTVLKQQGVVALAMLLRFAPGVLEPVLAPSVQLIFEAGQTDDSNMRNDVLIAIGNLVIAQLEILVEYKRQIIDLANL